jgi:hypothetical protein
MTLQCGSCALAFLAPDIVDDFERLLAKAVIPDTRFHGLPSTGSILALGFAKIIFLSRHRR